MWKGGKEDKMWGNSVARASYQLVCKKIQEKCPNFRYDIAHSKKKKEHLENYFKFL